MSYYFDSIISVYADFYLVLVSMLGSFGIAALLLSVLANLLMVYPLRWARDIERQEQEMQAVISPQLRRISEESTGAEQHHRINSLYSRYAYHPIYAIRLVAGLFVQLPFLILTFVMFNELSALDGESFLAIKDLGQPDGLLYGKGNLLPFLMTALNLLAALFIPRFTRKDLVRAVCVSLLFLALLYNAKSALLVFWTANNALMLLRNVLAYRSAEDDARFNFRRYGLKIQLFFHRRDVALFFVVFFLYAQIARFIFTNGFNEILTNAIYAFTILSLIGLLAFNIVVQVRGIGSSFSRTNRKKPSPRPISISDALLVLIPLSVPIQYAVLNRDVLSFRDQLLFVAVCGISMFALIWLVPFVLGKMFSIVGLAPLGLTLTLIYVSMPTFVLMSSWVEAPDLALLSAFFLTLFGFSYLLYEHQQRLLHMLSAVFFVVAITYTGYVTYALEEAKEVSPYLAKYRATVATVDFENFIHTGDIKKTPDVYLLTYDAYVGQKTMQAYGIDNSEQEAALKKLGFKIYPDTYSIAYTTVSSMSRVLEMADDWSKDPLISMAGNALVPTLFEKYGYKTHGVLPPSLLIRSPGYDFAFPRPDEKPRPLGLISLLRGLKEGQFRFDLVDEVSGIEHSELVEAKRRILGTHTDYPKFMYTHSKFPGHSQNSGTCLPNETELFEKRLEVANTEMMRDIETILATKRDAIIIVNGDHGPYLTGDCLNLRHLDSVEQVTQLDLQDRVGTFLAIRWPDDGYEQYDDIRTLQDVFECVFKYLFESEEVLRVRTGTVTRSYGATLPAGMVDNGRIMKGADKGRMLFEN